MLAIDPAAEAVQQTRAALDQRGHTAAEVRQATIEDLAAELAAPDGERFDVVHAHQVLQHLADPVGALRRMAGLCRPGGLIAARDSDYSAFAWYPRLPELDHWMELYQRLARANRGEPDAGRRLLAWAHAAGLDDVRAGASTWCFATPEDRAWWGGMWADRIVQSAMAEQLLARGWAAPSDLTRIAEAWRRWAADDDAWMALLHGEIVCRVT